MKRRASPLLIIAATAVILLVMLAVFAPLVAPYDPLDQSVLARFRGPSSEHWLGTDQFGRDLLSRVIYGLRASLGISVVAVGAALLAVENAPPGWRARFGCAPQMGAPAGFIAANGLFLLLGLWLTPDQFRDWGWRIPFLVSALLVGLGLWIRLKLTETPEFAASLEEARVWATLSDNSPLVTAQPRGRGPEAARSGP